MSGSDSLRDLLRAPREGLSSSWSDCPHVPSPLHRRVLGGCALTGSPFFSTSVAFDAQRAPAAQARLPLGPLWLPTQVNLTVRQSSLDATDRTVARPPCEDFVSGLRRPDFAGRRRSATRQLGLYRDRTCTGKPDQASSGHTQRRLGSFAVRCARRRNHAGNRPDCGTEDHATHY